MRFSAIYKPTTLFSLKDSNSTSSGAKSLLLPSPYAIKMAFLSQAISLGGEDFYENPDDFRIIRDAMISYHIRGIFCVNNCFVKIQKQRDKEPFKSTISFREYVYLNENIEIIFDVKDDASMTFLKKYLHKINYFGKRGCFFQFVNYNDNPEEANVKPFNVANISCGILQEYDDFGKNVLFDNVNNYSDSRTDRDKSILVIPLISKSSSKSYTSYKIF